MTDFLKRISRFCVQYLRVADNDFMETNDPKKSKNLASKTTQENQKRQHLGQNDEETKKVKIDEILQNTKMCELYMRSSELSNSFENVTFQLVPKKSQSDSKEYLAITLKNGLRALLISDVKNIIDPSLFNKLTLETENYNTESNDEEESEAEDDDDDDYKSSDEINNCDNHIHIDIEQKEKLAACALTIGVGSFSDPEEIPGLAHFLEHMVFMGSEKYPKENDFDSYISVRGGSDNALTECEHTTFYFDCPEIHLKGALDRFSNFFISPLMNRDSISREREAIESEFKLQLSSDTNRLEQLFCSTAPLNNPAHKFMWGNLITLQQNVNDEILYNELRSFWARHYSAHRMTLAIQARLPMDVLLEWVVEHFGDIRNNNLPPDTFPYVDPPFKMDSFNKLYTVKPVKDINKVILTWAMPSVMRQYQSKPLSYLSYLVGHEGEGSLLAYLQQKLWALSITAGNGENEIEHNTVYSLFTIDIALTEEGLLNIEDLLHLVFSYLKVLRDTGPVESLFREFQLIQDINFRFVEEEEAADYVECLSQSMQLYPSEEYITGNELVFEYNPEYISNIINLLIPDNVNIMIASTIAAAKVKLDSTEPWFNTKYNLKDIPEEWLTRWKNCEPNPNFYMPKPNKYIASDFTLLPITDDSTLYPQQIVKDERIETWYKQDTKFRLPLGYIRIYMISPSAISLPQNVVMCDLIVSLFHLKVVKDVYPAMVAALNYKFSNGELGLTLSVNGYNEKLPLLLETLLKEVATFISKITIGLFEAVKEEIRKKYFNRIIKPSVLANEMRLSILCKPHWTSISKMDALSNITLEKLQKFNQELFNDMYVKCLVQGNIDRNQAISITKSITDIINYKPTSETTKQFIQIRKIPTGEKILRVQAFNPNDPNGNVTNYYQCGRSDISNYCKIELLMMIMQEPLFDTLRTQEQLGYDIGCETRITNGTVGFTVTVKCQVDKCNVDYVEERISHFLVKMQKDLSNMTSADFKQVKESMNILKQQADNDLQSEVQRNWSEIISNEYMFDRNTREVAYLETLKRTELEKFFKNLMNETNNQNETTDTMDSTICLRKLSVQIDSDYSSPKLPNIHDKTEAIPDNSNNQKKLKLKVPEDKSRLDLFIQDLDTFKDTLYLYSPSKQK